MGWVCVCGGHPPPSAARCMLSRLLASNLLPPSMTRRLPATVPQALDAAIAEHYAGTSAAVDFEATLDAFPAAPLFINSDTVQEELAEWRLGAPLACCRGGHGIRAACPA